MRPKVECNLLLLNMLCYYHYNVGNYITLIILSEIQGHKL